MSDYISVAEAAKMIKVSTDTMYSIIELGNFPVLKIPRKKSITYRINKDEFEKWIKNHSV